MTQSTAQEIALGDVERERVFFRSTVRPLLSQRCFACHGPAVAKSGLRLDLRDSALLGGRSGKPAIVPGDPFASAVWQRINAVDLEERMPPAAEHPALATEELGALQHWIAAGAHYANHWSFDPVREPATALATLSTRDGIDHVVAAQLAAQGLAPAPAALRSVLLRRVSLDLMGLPPTPEALAEFNANEDQGALAAVLDDLLASPHFGERMALPWLDAARYADTNGYSIDDHRDMWAWRDWVIDAFNQNLPYDQFVLQQIAGDLLPEASETTQLATGYLRNSPSTHEGGIIPEEYRVTYIADKIDAVSTGFLGLTMRCAQCHDHKYDPLSQRDYYRMFAFFDQGIEPGVGGKNGNIAPMMDVRSPLLDEERMRNVARERIVLLEHYLLHPPDLIAEREAWIAAQRFALQSLVPGEAKYLAPQWIWSAGDERRVRFEKRIELAADLIELTIHFSCDNRARLEWNGIEVAESDDWTAPQHVVLPLMGGAFAGQLVVHAENLGGPAGFVALIEARSSSSLRRIGTDDAWECYAEPEQSTADTHASAEPLATRTLGAHGTAPWGRVLPIPDDEFLIALRADPRSDAQWRVLNASHAVVEPRWQGHRTALEIEIESLQRQLESGRVSTMVMGAGEARTTYVLQRGQYDQPDLEQAVEPGVPEAIFEWNESWPRTRLGLAQWIADPAHPLTARVAVNRVWQMLFGVGLVTTVNDFGSQGEVPPHLVLLDFLAHRFVQSGWDVKALVREIVLSATYAQSSNGNARAEALDPANRWHWRGARRRLPAELLRDQALALGGLLDLQLGGPSVFPAQPYGLWQELSHFGHPEPFTAQAYYPSRDRDLFRRSLYSFWKRSSPPPALAAFDAPTRENCTATRAETNTPLQALITLNDPEYVAAAAGFANRASQAAATVDERIHWMFYAATARRPSDREHAALRTLFDDAEAHLDAERAALALVAATILNLDETLTQH